MLNLFKKEVFAEKQKQPEVSSNPQVWIVRWRARYNSFPSDTRNEFKLFKSRQEAEIFREQLHQAAETLRYREPFKIVIEEASA